MMAAPHHRGEYRPIRDQVVQAANADPLTVCCHCGKTLARHAPHRNGRPATWTGGHTIHGVLGPPWLNVRSTPPPGAWIAPAASTCNYIDGGQHRWRLQKPRIVTTRRW